MKKKVETVIVRAYSGVFFGTLVAKKGDTCELKNARQVYTWDSKGLAEPVNTCGDIALRGVGSGSRVSSPVPRLLLEEVRATFFCEPAAVKSFEGQKWGTR